MRSFPRVLGGVGMKNSWELPLESIVDNDTAERMNICPRDQYKYNFIKKTADTAHVLQESVLHGNGPGPVH